MAAVNVSGDVLLNNRGDSEAVIDKTSEIEMEVETINENQAESDTTTDVEGTITASEKADLKKNEGNALYKRKNYAAALQLYTEAIGLCPKCAAYYGNRAATYIMLSKFSLALDDARRAIQLDPKFVKGHLREAKCHLSMGEAAPAIRSYEKVLQLEQDNSAASSEIMKAKALDAFERSAFSSIEKKDFRKVVYCMDRSLEVAPLCSKFKVMKAESLIYLKRLKDAQAIINDVVRFDSKNADAMYVRGLALYYEDNIDKAFQHFQHVLRLAPDHLKARECFKKAKALIKKKEEGNTAFRTGSMSLALRLYTEALEIDQENVFTNSKLYCNRATVYARLKKNAEGIADCNKAIDLDGNYTKAYLRRAKCYMEEEMFEEAVRDYEKVFQMEKSREHKQLLHEANFELKKSKRKDFYKILGVNKDASEDELRKAYKKRALLHHPDRHSNSSDTLKKEEEQKFKEIGEAYAILTDPKKRSRYDNGQDLDGVENGFGAAEFDPNVIFQSFFGGGGGGFHQFHHAGHPGHPSHAGHAGHGPGFSFQFG